MVFRQCSISGILYKGDPSPPTSPGEGSVAPTNAQADGSISISRFEKAEAMEGGDVVPPQPQDAGSSLSAGTTPPPATENLTLPKGVEKRFRDSVLASDIIGSVNPGPGNEARARALHGFFVVLSLCHTVLTSVDPNTGAIEYKAQSPDEAALVQAAADMGFVFRGRDHETLLLQTPFSEEIEKYELLNILEFTSARKRMSVVLRRADGEDGRLFLLTKGADNVIFERLKPGSQDELKEVTGAHLDQFAGEGLRTLTLAYKVIPGEIPTPTPLIWQWDGADGVALGCRSGVCVVE
jgi:phospholipid-translocating ATPase